MYNVSMCLVISMVWKKKEEKDSLVGFGVASFV